MTHVMGDGTADITFDNTRTPVFLSPSMAVVFTHSTVTTADRTHDMTYADILIRKAGTWAFQTMIQSGWGDNL